MRGNFKPPLWRRAWLGAWHGLASTDIRGRTVDVLGHWVREAKVATRLEDLGTLTVRYAANGPDLTTTREGIANAAGLTLTFQSRNRAIIFAKPHTNRDKLLATLGEEGVTRLATVVGLWNFSQPRTWTLYADGKKIESFPHRLKAGQRILVHDGVSYLAILPLPASDLGRDVEIEIAAGIAGQGRADRRDGGARPHHLDVQPPARAADRAEKPRPQGRHHAHPWRPGAGDGRRPAARQLRGLRPPHRCGHAQGGVERGQAPARRRLSQRRRSPGSRLHHGFQPVQHRSFPDRSGRPGARHPLPAAERRLALPAGRAGARHELGAAGHDRPAREGGRRAGHRARPQGLPDRRSR